MSDEKPATTETPEEPPFAPEPLLLRTYLVLAGAMGISALTGVLLDRNPQWVEVILRSPVAVTVLLGWLVLAELLSGARSKLPMWAIAPLLASYSVVFGFVMMLTYWGFTGESFTKALVGGSIACLAMGVYGHVSRSEFRHARDVLFTLKAALVIAGAVNRGNPSSGWLSIGATFVNALVMLLLTAYYAQEVRERGYVTKKDELAVEAFRLATELYVSIMTVLFDAIQLFGKRRRRRPRGSVR